jgi:tetratricopeptide (TPR) repeat protein
VLEDLGRLYPAEKQYLQTAETVLRDEVKRRPEAVLSLIALVGRQGRVAEALDLCAGAWQTAPVDAVSYACMAALHTAPPRPEDIRRVEGWFNAARPKSAAAATALLLCRADLCDLQGHYADAIVLYRQVLERDRDNTVALNNLAYLLALKEGQHKTSLELLKHAIDVAGPVPELLDSRALIHLSMGQSALAIKDLQEAIEDTPMPVACFHLAQAHHMTKNRAAAVIALRKAKKAGLKVEQLHALERPAYRTLQAELDPG